MDLCWQSNGRQTENHNHRKLIILITGTTALSNPMKLWAMPCVSQFMTKTTWPTKPKKLPIWSFTEKKKVPTLGLDQCLHHVDGGREVQEGTWLAQAPLETCIQTKRELTQGCGWVEPSAPETKLRQVSAPFYRAAPSSWGDSGKYWIPSQWVSLIWQINEWIIQWINDVVKVYENPKLI